MSRNVTFVFGPCGAGKSRWIAERARPGDVRVDLDAIRACLTGLPPYARCDAAVPFAMAARDGVLDRIARTESVTAYVESAEPDPYRRAVLATTARATNVVVLDTPADECLRRIAADPRRKGIAVDWPALVRAWHAAHQARKN